MIGDLPFKLAVGAGGLALVVGLTAIHACGAVELPPKPPPPRGPTGTATQLLTESNNSPQVWRSYLERDAATAGLHAPSPEELAQLLPYQSEEARHLVGLDQPPLELVGLRLHLERSGNAVELVIENTLDVPVAYHAQTEANLGAYVCESVPARRHDALVLSPRQTVARTECAWREGLTIALVRVETIQLPPLSAFYVRQVPPTALGFDARISKAHETLTVSEPCNPTLPQAVRGGLERREIEWRDLVDFYARHRCQTYQFPVTYRAFRRDGERPLPAAQARH